MTRYALVVVFGPEWRRAFPLSAGVGELGRGLTWPELLGLVRREYPRWGNLRAYRESAAYRKS